MVFWCEVSGLMETTAVWSWCAIINHMIHLCLREMRYINIINKYINTVIE